jgi:hypothetical protein
MTPLKVVLDLLNTPKRKWLTDPFVSQDNRQAQENEGLHNSQGHHRPIKGQILTEKCPVLRNETMFIR